MTIIGSRIIKRVTDRSGMRRYRISEHPHECIIGLTNWDILMLRSTDPTSLMVQWPDLFEPDGSARVRESARKLFPDEIMRDSEIEAEDATIDDLDAALARLREQERADIRAKLKTMAAIVRAGCDAIERGDFEVGAEVIGLAATNAPRASLSCEDSSALYRGLSDVANGIKFLARVIE